jgi:predicted small metal-binding protein
MTFRLACGDVMPGCTARFESSDQDQLLAQVADHAAAEHGITEIAPEIAEAVGGKIVVAV